MNYQNLREMLITDEGLRLKPYKDSVGKLTIGVGRNLDDVGISKDECMILLDNDILAAVDALDKTFPWWRGMSEIRQRVLVNMCFNMGIARLAGFKNALAAMQRSDWETAALEMQYEDVAKKKESSWYQETGGRAIRLVSLMRNGA